MDAIDEGQFQRLLKGARVRRSESGVGQQLSLANSPRRTIVLRFGQDQDLLAAVRQILDLENSWLVAPRCGSVAGLGLIEDARDAVAVLFRRSERAALADYLCARCAEPTDVPRDLYVVSGSGQTLVALGCHPAEDGPTIEVQSAASDGIVLDGAG